MRYIVMIFFILCSFVFAQSNIDEDSIHFIGQAIAFTVGGELVTDGDFPDFDNWAEGTGWTVANNKASQNNNAADLTQTITGLTNGRLYRIQYEITDFTDGVITSVLNDVESGDKGAVGVYTSYLVASGTSHDLDMRGDASFTGSISNVSMVAWPGDLNAGGGCTLNGFEFEGNELLDIMGANGEVLHHDSGLALADSSGNLLIVAASTWDQTPIVGTFVKCVFSALFPDGVYEITNTGSSTIEIDLPSEGLGAETVEVWIGGAYPDIATALNDSTLSQGYVTVPFTGAGTYVMKPGDEIDGDTSGATATILGVTITSGTFGAGNAAGTLRITVPTVASFQAEQIDVGGSNDVADVTAAESSTYRKRYICVNVDQEVDAVTDFVAETSETAHREDDASRKLIGFYDSIEVVTAHSSYRVVSDMDYGQTYYGGAWSAFHFSEGFPIDRPAAFTISELTTNGDLSTWDVSGNYDDDPAWWEVDGEVDAARRVTEVNGQCQIKTSGDYVGIGKTVILTPGKFYRIMFDVITVSAGTLKVSLGGVSIGTVSVTGKVVFFGTATTTTFQIGRNATPTDITIDNVEITEVVHPGWVSWNAKGNDFGATGILVLDTSNFEMRNIHLYNTIADGGNEGLLHIDTANYNIAFTNCWFDTSSRLLVDDLASTGSNIVDCYFGADLDSGDIPDFTDPHFTNCIFNGTNRTVNIGNMGGGYLAGCLFYEGQSGLRIIGEVSAFNTIFYGQTVDGVRVNSATAALTGYNNIFMLAAAADVGIYATSAGSMSPVMFNNIFWTVAGVAMTNPINHAQITPNPPLPVGSIEKDPLFVNTTKGDFRLRPESPALNGGLGGGSIGVWQPYALPRQERRSRYAGPPLYR